MAKDKLGEGLGYSAVPPPHNDNYTPPLEPVILRCQNEDLISINTQVQHKGIFTKKSLTRTKRVKMHKAAIRVCENVNHKPGYNGLYTSNLIQEIPTSQGFPLTNVSYKSGKDIHKVQALSLSQTLPLS